MALTLTDEELQTMGMSAREARVEIACRLFDAERVTFHAAIRLAGMNRLDFEAALHDRGIALYRPTIEDTEADLATLDRIGV
jgi:predicted HTH domain antitoxin